MRLRVLGPIQAWDGTQWRSLGAPKLRLLFAALLVRPGQGVSVQQLIDDLWGDEPPRQAANQIHGYVVRIRRALNDPDGQVLTSRSPGYALHVGEADLDTYRFEALVAHGLAVARNGDAVRAAKILSEALGLWRGPAFADVPTTLSVQAEADRLEECRLTALEARIDADLALGRHADIISELQVLTAKHALRERLWAQLMLGLYRVGRQADALDAYRRLYQHLVDDLGLEPSSPLRELQEQILNSDPALDRPASAQSSPAPHQLPADIGNFIGREHHLRYLDGLLTVDDGQAAALPIAVIAGPGGIGKTSLAVHWAHQAASHFRDAQFFLDLRGYDADPPLTPLESLSRFLRALGVTPECVPLEVDEATAMYRSLLADKRALVVIDNAASADQVLPLLPGSSSCLAIVTSRDRLDGLVARSGAHHLELDGLSDGESRTLLASILGSERVDAEPDAAAELVRRCDRLPLALRLTAANLTANNYRRLTDAVADLDTSSRLESLQLAGDPANSVAATFELSYHKLGAEQRRLFRLLGLFPGLEFGVSAASVLIDAEGIEVTRSLDGLVRKYLLDRRGADRYGFHDLLRLFAAARCEQDESEDGRDTAMVRLLDWYLRTTVDAVHQILPGSARLPETDEAAPSHSIFEAKLDAMNWLDKERANLVAITRYAAQGDGEPTSWLLADALRGYFFVHRHPSDWIHVALAGQQAAQRRDDVRGQAACSLSLAQAHRCINNYTETQAYARQALDLCRKAHWPSGEAAVLNEIAVVSLEQGRADRAIEPLEQALRLDQATVGHGNYNAYLMNLGLAHRMTGRFPRAAEILEQVVDLAREYRSGAPHRESSALVSLGEVYRSLGRFDQARACLARAQALQQELGYQSGLVTSIDTLALLALDEGNHEEALEHATTVQGLARELQSRRMETAAMATSGAVRARLGEHSEAVRAYQRAVREAGETGNAFEQADYRIGLADVLLHLGSADAAQREAYSAVQTSVDLAYRDLEGRARTVLARCHLDRGEPEAAQKLAAAAASVLHECGDRLAEAHALRLLSDIADDLGDADGAQAYARGAHAIFRDLGVPEAD